MINVTKTYLPDFDKYISVLKRAWDKAWITNNGELVQELEAKLKDYLGVKNLLFTSNGTIVLQMALKALNITGEVITTPYSYVATTNAILWESCTPVFADIDPVTLCIDPEQIEKKITSNTQAILATHVYGHPCDIEKIEILSAKYKLKVIYDGAHAFGCEYGGRSLLSYGDITTCSFHATKVFHTVEGGCIITNDDEIAQRLMLYRQFGHIGEEHLSMGINAKNSEFHAAMGLCLINDFEGIIEERQRVASLYDRLLDTRIKRMSMQLDRFTHNFSYYPVFFSSEPEMKKVQLALLENNINSRRYFYPSLNTLLYLPASSCIVSERISSLVLCLPMYAGLDKTDVYRICSVINESIK